MVKVSCVFSPNARRPTCGVQVGQVVAPRALIEMPDAFARLLPWGGRHRRVPPTRAAAADAIRCRCPA